MEISSQEGSSMPLPVIAMEDESIAGFVRDGYNGRLFHNVDELANALCEVLSNDFYRKELSNNALHSITPLSAETFGLNAETFYKEILASHPKTNQSASRLHINFPKFTKSK